MLECISRNTDMIVFEESECCAMHSAVTNAEHVFRVMEIDADHPTLSRIRPDIFEHVPHLALDRISRIFTKEQTKLGMLVGYNRERLVAFVDLAEWERWFLLGRADGLCGLSCEHTPQQHIQALECFIEKIRNACKPVHEV